jgi:predicted phosphoribosyltransferase
MDPLRHVDPPLYEDRAAAGRLLGARVAEALAASGRGEEALVLGLPRGGVPVAAAVAEALDAPLDVLLVRKLGVPGHEELAMGAIASGGVRVLNQDVLDSLGIPPALVDRVAARELDELRRREAVYRGSRAYPALAGRTVVLVDDGLATGASMRAAARAVRQRGPAAVVVAVPVAPVDTVEALRAEVDEVVCPATPLVFLGVGMWYADFAQTTDDEVRDLLARAWRQGTGATRPGG